MESVQDEETASIAPANKAFMINYRVQHMEAMVDKLRENGVIITTYATANSSTLWPPTVQHKQRE